MGETMYEGVFGEKVVEYRSRPKVGVSRVDRRGQTTTRMNERGRPIIIKFLIITWVVFDVKSLQNEFLEYGTLNYTTFTGPDGFYQVEVEIKRLRV